LCDVFEFIVNKSRLIALARVVLPPGKSLRLGNKMADFEFRGVPIVEIQMQISKKLQVSSSANKQKCERW
jgi:molybdopterin-guanine dinucleotide biosynthesis protein A